MSADEADAREPAALRRPARQREPAALRKLLPAALALLGIVLLLNLISFAFGQAPLTTLRLVYAGTWGTPYGIGQVLFKATPLIFTALAFEIARRAGLFNIGAEGQVALGSLAGGVVGAHLPAGTPWLIAVPVCVAAAALTGALVALIPALMRARLGVHEIITTIMLNRIVEVLLPFLLVTVLGAAALRTVDVAPGAALLKLDRIFPALRGSAASLAFPLAVALSFGVDAQLRRTRMGREMRWIGVNAAACRAEGIDVARRRVQAMLISGATAGAAMAATVLGYKGYYELGLGAGAGFTGIDVARRRVQAMLISGATAGAAMAATVLGYKGYYELGLGAGAGFTGIAVALLGRGNALGIVAAAVLFGTLQQAGLAVNARVPKEAMDVLAAAVILFVAVANRAAAEPLTPVTEPDPAPPAPEAAP